MNIKAALGWLLVSIFLGSCATLDYVVTPPSEAALSLARAEIFNKGKLTANGLSLTENLARLNRVEQNLRPSALNLCMALGDRPRAECSYELKYIEDDDFNAYATNDSGKNIVVVTTGALRKTHSDDELSFVVAHEIGHHIADHLTESSGFTFGEAIGLILGAAILADSGSNIDPDVAQDFIEGTTAIGGAFDRPKFNRNQESEADLIAMKMIVSAGYDDKKARNVLVNMASISNPTNFFASHPSGETRVAHALTYRSEPAFIEIAAIENITICGSRVCGREGLNSLRSTIASTEVDSEVRDTALTLEPKKANPTLASTNVNSGVRDAAFTLELKNAGSSGNANRNVSLIINKYADKFVKAPNLIGFRQVYYTDSYPPKKIAKFLKKANLPADTDILGYYDSTLNGGGKNGFLFTSEGIYFNKMRVKKTTFLTYLELSNNANFTTPYIGLLDLDGLVKGGVFVGAGNIYKGTMNNNAITMGNLIFELANFR